MQLERIGPANIEHILNHQDEYQRELELDYWRIRINAALLPRLIPTSPLYEGALFPGKSIKIKLTDIQLEDVPRYNLPKLHPMLLFEDRSKIFAEYCLAETGWGRVVFTDTELIFIV